ncbi:MAG: SDR family oxidoreductase [Bryobacteraceae bacterium]|nr:SDR family oxidoreductase [Bryobacteraceae bacterium]
MPVLDLFRLDGRLALVTGCRRGIGLAIAEALAQAGADIAGVSRSLEAEGSEAERRVRACGRRFYGFRCDLADRAALRELPGRIASELPPVDILVNNAGVILRAPASQHPDEYWDQVLAANLTAPWILAREIGRTMLERGSGKIIFIASLLSFQGGILVPSYAASKGGVAQLVKALANEWAPRGVNVNAIAPGYIATDNTAPLRADAARNRAILERIPAGRWGEPADLAGAAVFLASRASDYVHGSILVVDGGWMGR